LLLKQWNKLIIMDLPRRGGEGNEEKRGGEGDE
jgi:hypothetical protein